MAEKMNDGYVGIYMPKKICEYLALYCVEKGKSRTAVINRIVLQAVSGMETDNTLIIRLREKYQHQWISEVFGNKDADFSLFQNKIRRELRMKKVATHHIKLIVEGIKKQR